MEVLFCSVMFPRANGTAVYPVMRVAACTSRNGGSDPQTFARTVHYTYPTEIVLSGRKLAQVRWSYFMVVLRSAKGRSRAVQIGFSNLASA
jgi:hypothetical protein